MRYNPSHCYLGPEKLPQWLKKQLPYWWIFNRPAYTHDLFFREGGGRKEFDRANRIFRTMCLAALRRFPRSEFGWHDPTMRKWCIRYIWAVDKFGKYFFRWRGPFTSKIKRIQ